MATADEPQEEVVARYRRVWAHVDVTIADHPLDAVGRVPWWPAGKNEVTLHRALVHVLTELHRHTGHADMLREGIDGAAGLFPGNDNLPGLDGQPTARAPTYNQMIIDQLTDDKVDTLFHARADATRRDIVRRAVEGEFSVSRLADAYP